MDRRPRRERRPRYGLDQGDEPWAWPSWLWYLAPAPLVAVVVAMVVFDSFVIVGAVVLAVVALAPFIGHELGEW